MKHALILAAALGFSASAAGACSMHKDDVHAKVDTATVASIAGDEGKTVAAPSTTRDEEKAPMSVRSDKEKAD